MKLSHANQKMLDMFELVKIWKHTKRRDKAEEKGESWLQSTTANYKQKVILAERGLEFGVPFNLRYCLSS